MKYKLLIKVIYKSSKVTDTYIKEFNSEKGASDYFKGFKDAYIFLTKNANSAIEIHHKIEEK